MATGLEMLISTLIKAAKIEPEIEKLKAALNGDFLERIKTAVQKVEKFDARLERIERALGIEPDTFEPGSSPDFFPETLGLSPVDPPQSEQRLDN